MPTEHGYPDDEQVTTPHGNVLVEGSGLSVPASPATVDDTNLGVAAYRSIVITADVTGNPVTFEIDWTMALDGSGVVITTSGSLATGASQQRIQCQGRFIPTIRYSGSGGAATMDYTIVGSNIDPPLSRPWPMHQYIDLAGIFTFGNMGAGGTALGVDAGSLSNHILSTKGIGNYITFYFLLGPQYARHEVVFTGNKAPNFGIQHYYLAKLFPDADGYANPAQLIANSYNGSPAVTWVPVNASVDRYAAALTKNIVWGLNWRVMGAEGAPLTTVGIDADGFPSIDGGPGMYALQARMDTKFAGSAGYGAQWSCITVNRIDDSGFM